MTSSDLRMRIDRPCSPSDQRSASARLDLPEPLGPTTALIPGPNSTSVRSANDLKPWTRRPRRRAGALTSPAPSGRRAPPGAPGAGPRAPPPRPTSRRPAATVPRRRRARARRRRPRSGTASRGPGRRPRGSGRRAARPEIRWVCSCRRLLGLLSVVIARSAASSSAAQRWIQSRAGLPAEVEVDRAGDRLERRGQEGRADPAAALGLALAEEQERPEVEPGGQAREPGRADDGGAARGQDALVVERVATEQRLGHGEVHHRVPEELEPLVVTAGGLGMLVEPAAVDERLREQVAIADGEPEAFRQRVGRVHVAPGEAARTSARRCSRRRPGRCGSSPRPRPRSRSRTLPRGS